LRVHHALVTCYLAPRLTTCTSAVQPTTVSVPQWSSPHVSPRQDQQLTRHSTKLHQRLLVVLARLSQAGPEQPRASALLQSAALSAPDTRLKTTSESMPSQYRSGQATMSRLGLATGLSADRHPASSQPSAVQVIDWMTTSHSFLCYPGGPGCTSATLGYGNSTYFTGTTADLRLSLNRNNHWQDGGPVTAWDVKYSFINLNATAAFQATS